jgi:hypothetical protein
MFAAVITYFHMSSERHEICFVASRDTWREARSLVDAELWVLAADLCAVARLPLDTTNSQPFFKIIALSILYFRTLPFFFNSIGQPSGQ